MPQQVATVATTTCVGLKRAGGEPGNGDCQAAGWWGDQAWGEVSGCWDAFWGVGRSAVPLHICMSR
eukprot:219790-Chlamydomonas_euryale.AAC.2